MLEGDITVLVSQGACSILGLLSTRTAVQMDFFHLVSVSALRINLGCLDRVNDAAPQMAFVKSAAGRRKVVSSFPLVCPPRFFVRVKRRSGVTRMGSDLAAKRTGKFQSSHEGSAAEGGNCCIGQNKSTCIGSHEFSLIWMTEAFCHLQGFAAWMVECEHSICDKMRMAGKDADSVSHSLVALRLVEFLFLSRFSGFLRVASDSLRMIGNSREALSPVEGG